MSDEPPLAHAPAGLQAERTRLAWGRTNTSIIGSAIAITKLAGTIGPHAVATCCALSLLAAAGLWLTTGHRYRRSIVAVDRLDGLEFDSRGARPLVLVAGVATFVPLTALVVIVAALSTKS